MRSRASAKSAAVIVFRPARTATIAASLTRFARSAPEKPGVARADRVDVDVVGQVLVARVHREDGGAFPEVRQRDLDLAVEPARPQQRGVERLRTIRRREHDHARGGFEAVHFREHLVQGLLALVVRDVAGAPALADGVDLVDEDDRGCGLARRREQISHAGRADADEQLDEARPGRARRTARSASPATARAKSVFPVPGGPTINTPRGVIAPAAA